MHCTFNTYSEGVPIVLFVAGNSSLTVYFWYCNFSINVDITTASGIDITTWGTTDWWTSGAGSRLGLLHNPWLNCTTTQQEKDLSVLPFSCKTIRPQGTHPYQLKLYGSRSTFSSFNATKHETWTQKHTHGTSNAEQQMITTESMVTTTLYDDGVRRSLRDDDVCDDDDDVRRGRRCAT